MSDWDSVTKIGKNVRGPGADRETTVRGKSALNAAQRSGAILSTDKKYSTANVSQETKIPQQVATPLTPTSQAASANLGGQRLTKVDRADGPVATKKVPEEVAKALMQARNQLKNQKGTTMTQKDLASKANVDVKVVADLERTGADFPAMDAVLKLQKAANVRLTGSNIGEPMLGPKKKA